MFAIASTVRVLESREIMVLRVPTFTPPPQPPAATAASNYRACARPKIVIRNPSWHCSGYTATRIINRKPKYPPAPTQLGTSLLPLVVLCKGLLPSVRADAFWEALAGGIWGSKVGIHDCVSLTCSNSG